MKEEGDGPKIEAVDAPGAEAGQAFETEPADRPETETDEGSAPEGGRPESVGDSLELDRMEVEPEVGMREEQQKEVGEVIVEPAGSEPTESAHPNVLALLADYWIWMVALLLGLSVVSAVLWFVLVCKGGAEFGKWENREHVVTASLGGEHYAHFRLSGPFGDSKGQEVLRRALPKIKHDLILSGGQPEVARSIARKDTKFLKGHILGIVSDETGIPIGELDLKGLSVTRYSDAEEVERERGS